MFLKPKLQNPQLHSSLPSTGLIHQLSKNFNIRYHNQKVYVKGGGGSQFYLTLYVKIKETLCAWEFNPLMFIFMTFSDILNLIRIFYSNTFGETGTALDYKGTSWSGKTNNRSDNARAAEYWRSIYAILRSVDHTLRMRSQCLHYKNVLRSHFVDTVAFHSTFINNPR